MEASTKISRANTVEEARSLSGVGKLSQEVRAWIRLARSPYSGLVQARTVRIQTGKKASNAVGRGAGRGSEGIDLSSHVATDAGVA